MSSVTFTAREFNQNPSAVKRAAADGPVFVTDRGAEALVVMNIDDYRRLSGSQQTLYERLMALPATGFDIDFEPDRASAFDDRDIDLD